MNKEEVEKLEGLPLFFKYLEEVNEYTSFTSEFKEKVLVEIDFYQSKDFRVYPFYKPISKIYIAKFLWNEKEI